MDEQDIIAAQEYSEPEPDYSEPEFEEPTPPEPESEPEELTTDWGINSDGEVEFSDDYLNEAEETLFPNRTEPPKDESESPEATQPNYYTPEELENTPYEQWDINRLNGNVKDFAPIVQKQLLARQRQAQAIQRQQANQLSNYIPAPSQYSPKELAEAAQKLAIEKLGLQDPEDFDEYEGEHRAALNLAMQELSSQRQAEVANYQRASGEYQQLQAFNQQLESQPDFKEFYAWYSDKLSKKGLTPQQVNAGLWNYASNNGFRFGEIAQIMGNWYREFQQTKATRPRASRPPALESTRGKAQEGTGGVSMRSFGEMSPEQQERALIRMEVNVLWLITLKM